MTLAGADKFGGFGSGCQSLASTVQHLVTASVWALEGYKVVLRHSFVVTRVGETTNCTPGVDTPTNV